MMVPAQQATAFRALAQSDDLGVSAALRQMIADRVQAAAGQGKDLLPPDVAVGHSKQINVRLRDCGLPEIKSGHIRDAIRRGLVGKEYPLPSLRCAIAAHPYPKP